MTANAGMSVTCERCGKSFHVKPYRLKLAEKRDYVTRYCSRACWKASPPERLWSRVDVRGPDECWPWKGGGRVRNYGRLKFEGETRLAHHVSFKLKHGYWPDYLRHSCDNPPCCNDAHLLEGTHADNMQDAVERGRRPRGEAMYCAKLTEADVRAIRADPRSNKQVAETYGVNPAGVSRIRSRKIWKHVQ